MTREQEDVDDRGNRVRGAPTLAWVELEEVASERRRPNPALRGLSGQDGSLQALQPGAWLYP